MHATEQIAVVPAFDLGKVHVQRIAQCACLVFSEAEIRGQITRCRHRELIKHVKHRMSAILFDGKNARHIGKRDVRFVLKQVAQESDECLLGGNVMLGLAKHGIPFIDNKHEARMPRLRRGGKSEGLEQASAVRLNHARKCLGQLGNQFARNESRHTGGAARLTKELPHVEIHHVVGVEMCSIRRTLSGSEVIKQAMRVDSALVVCAQHACRHGLTETPRTADANISIATGKHAIVEMGDEAALVHVDASPAVDGHGLVARIEIYAHVHARLSSQSQRATRLKPPKQTRPHHTPTLRPNRQIAKQSVWHWVASAPLPNYPAVTLPPRAGRI